MLSIIAWLLVGLAAGAIARLLVPGRDRLGFGGTLLLGLVGSLIGGFLGWLLLHHGHRFSPAGFLGSIVGAVVALVVYRSVVRRRRGVFGGRRSSWRRRPWAA
jgi:uncharacterized membrane protein YeaQ/YmgE (transglycosylase-associated protein family)